jgi:transcriptional regulator with XRE-family HTH domain
MDNLAIRTGNIIRKKRKELNISQTDLANSVGISQSAINQYEKGVKKPSTVQLIAIAKELKTTPDVLLGYNKVEDKDLIVIKGLKELSNSDKDTVLDLIDVLKKKSKKK